MLQSIRPGITALALELKVNCEIFPLDISIQKMVTAARDLNSDSQLAQNQSVELLGFKTVVNRFVGQFQAQIEDENIKNFVSSDARVDSTTKEATRLNESNVLLNRMEAIGTYVRNITHKSHVWSDAQVYMYVCICICMYIYIYIHYTISKLCRTFLSLSHSHCFLCVNLVLPFS